MQTTDDRYHFMTLALTGINSRTALHLLSVYGSPEQVLAADRDDLMERAELSKESADRLILWRDPQAIEHQMQWVERYKIRLLCYGHDDYPRSLMFCEDAPLLLFCKGSVDFNAPEQRFVSIVGTRRMNDFSMNNCQQIIDKLSQHYPDTIIVSGLAHGVDAVAHHAAIGASLKTVAVVAHGLDIIYPADNRPLAQNIIEQGGAIISEYPFGIQPLKHHFVARNRIVAGLGAATIMVQSPMKGGAMITADLADGYGREVFTFPARLSDQSCAGNLHLLQSNKAHLLIGLDDIEYMMGWERKRNEETFLPLTPILTPQEQQVYDLFDTSDHISVDHLVEYCNIDIAQANATLTDMELNGIIKAVMGRMYIKVK